MVGKGYGNEPYDVDFERSFNPGEHLFGVTNTDFAPANGVPARNWEAPIYAMPEGRAEVRSGGRVISVKWGDYIKGIGIDGSPKEIKEAIRSAFGMRNRQPFWLEDDEGIIQCIGRHMPLRVYTLSVDEAPIYAMPEGRAEVGSGGRVISVKWGDYIKSIGIDGSPKEIKEAIRSAFGMRTRQPFWLEDDEGIIRCIGRHMPLRLYTLNVDEGLTIKIDLCNGFNETPSHVVEKTFYKEDDFHAFLQRHGFVALKDLDCCRIVDSIVDLRSGEFYQGFQASGSLKYFQLSSSVAQITNF